MKRIAFMLMAFVMAFASVMAADDFDYVFLKNGSVVKGVITEQVENQSVTIQSTNGQTYTYPAIEVLRITRGEGPVKPTKHQNINGYRDYGAMNTGFWCAVEFASGYSLNSRKAGNACPMELDFTAGYRFNEYLRVGLGLGARYYLRNDHLRSRSIPWAYPMFVNVRGNFIPSTYRHVVPYYSVNVGGTIRDGFMWSPTVGIRIGQNRNAALIGLSYMGQSLDRCKYFNATEGIKGKYTSFLMVRVGYEF